MKNYVGQNLHKNKDNDCKFQKKLKSIGIKIDNNK